MKHPITLVVSALAVVGACALSVNVHRQAAQQQLMLDAKNAAVHARQIAQEQTQAHANALKVQHLAGQCQVGVTAYTLLTPAQRLHVAKPDCSL